MKVVGRNGSLMDSTGEKRITYGTVYFDEEANDLIEINGALSSKPVTNYEYEEKLENDKRQIYVLKKRISLHAIQ